MTLLHQTRHQASGGFVVLQRQMTLTNKTIRNSGQEYCICNGQDEINTTVNSNDFLRQ